MAHYAKVLDGKVLDVIKADPEFFDNFVDDSPGEWIATSYNMYGGVYLDENRNPVSDQSIIDGDPARERKNYAGVGFSYDGTGFYSPKPFDSWVLNTTSYLWEAPVPRPEGDCYWNEEAGEWSTY